MRMNPMDRSQKIKPSRNIKQTLRQMVRYIDRIIEEFRNAALHWDKVNQLKQMAAQFLQEFPRKKKQQSTSEQDNWDQQKEELFDSEEDTDDEPIPDIPPPKAALGNLRLLTSSLNVTT